VVGGVVACSVECSDGARVPVDIGVVIVGAVALALAAPLLAIH
jgi:hypothetical protein